MCREILKHIKKLLSLFCSLSESQLFDDGFIQFSIIL